MQNVFLQFLNRRRLANRLSQYDLLKEIPDKSFLAPYRLEAFFHHHDSSDDLCLRIRSFLQATKDDYLSILANQVYLNYADFSQPLKQTTKSEEISGEYLLRQKKISAGRKYYQKILQEQSSPWASEILFLSNKIWNKEQDMRLYAADFQEINHLLQTLPQAFTCEIDWCKTSADSLWVNFADSIRKTSKLNEQEQQNLALIFAEMFFAKGWFISFWQEVLINPQHQILFADYDNLYPADSFLQNFLVEYLNGKSLPQSLLEKKIVAALKTLQWFTPQICLKDLWQNWLQKDYLSLAKGQKTVSPSFEQTMRHQGLNFLPPKDSLLQNPQDLMYLLDSSRHKKDAQFKKSSIKYWLPLLILIWLLLKYF